MSQWVRLWEDMPNDPKWRVVRHRALRNVPDISLGDVVLVFVHMMTNAGLHNGDIENWSDEDIAAAMELKTEQISAIRDAMQGKVLEGNHLKGWEKRQPKREDNSTERVREFRKRRNAEKLGVTQRDAPEEKREDTDTEKKVHSTKKFVQRALSKKMEFEKEGFEQFWEAYGHKLQRKRAEQAYSDAVQVTVPETILEAVKNYHRTRPEWQQIALAASWLKGERWHDQPAPNGHDPPSLTPEQRWAEYWPIRNNALAAAGKSSAEIETEKLLRMKSFGVANG
jgi:hypothetical protein